MFPAATCKKQDENAAAAEPPTLGVLRSKAQAAMLQVINSTPYKRKIWPLSPLPPDFSSPSTAREIHKLETIGAQGLQTYVFDNLPQELAATTTKDEWQIIAEALTSNITFSALLEDTIGHDDCPLHLTSTAIVDPKRSWLRYLGAFLSSQEHGPLRIKPWMNRHFVPLAEMIHFVSIHASSSVGSNARSEKKRPVTSTDDWKGSKRRALANVSNTSQSFPSNSSLPPNTSLPSSSSFEVWFFYTQKVIALTHFHRANAASTARTWEREGPHKNNENVNVQAASSAIARPSLSTNIKAQSSSSAIARPTSAVTFKPSSSSVPCTSWSFAHSKNDTLASCHRTILPVCLARFCRSSSLLNAKSTQLPRAVNKDQGAAKTKTQDYAPEPSRALVGIPKTRDQDQHAAKAKTPDAPALAHARVAIPKPLDKDQDAAKKTQDSAPVPVSAPVLRCTPREVMSLDFICN
ncbi:hypothetical protein C8R45DRAFT_927255 [Mycena sanguinolenta]|nr:hypothetical protein C8R45DRAFT_927255 [Mycena sanguinolenta]